MRTNAKTRKTMPQEWAEFFKSYKGKYFKDGFECCIAEPEHGFEKGYAQTAKQRTQLVNRWYAEIHGYKGEIAFMDRFFGHKDYMPGIVDVCCTQHDSGVYIYDRMEMMRKGYMRESPKKRKNYNSGEEMGKNKYYRVPLHLCYKIIDLWDVPRRCSRRRLYQMAVWQYTEMMKPNSQSRVSIYDEVETWEDLPDWCFWKYMLPDGTVIEGREQAFEDYKNKIRSHASYVPTLKSKDESSL